MATLVLSAAGAALGGSFGGSLFGLSSVVLGRAVGATVGSLIDSRLLGANARPVESGRVDRIRVMGSGEGMPLPRVFGRMRVAGQVIWSSRFVEDVSRQRVGGKGSRRGSQEVREYSYSISLALALCEGEVVRVGRIWADGQPLAQAGLTWRLHPGSEDQMPDPLIAAIEGGDQAPAYRGTAYVVIEDLELAPFGNRIPQFNFEVFRRPEAARPGAVRPPALDIKGVALVPGTGEYALATEPVYLERGRGEGAFANVNNDRGIPDFIASLDQLDAELPGCEAVSMIVSWFGDDLRADRCRLIPAVEQRDVDGEPMPWAVAGLPRSEAPVVSSFEGRPLFGGTPSDASVAQAIRHMSASGKAVMFYPFILMDILAGNGRENPWNPAAEQPAVPWRGRITLSRAPGTPGSPDKTPAARDEVAAFFGAAAPSDFTVAGDRVSYSGPAEWSYRRFILHYAHLCAMAGGVEAFCIGSEMRSLSQIRDAATSYPAVDALCRLAADVRGILGPGVKIGYAADWSEYFGHQPSDGSGDAVFHLDPLWSHPAIDFIGIDNYMPLSDWRDGADHRDAAVETIYDLDYLRSNVAGGEGYDWYYADGAARDAQHRTPISDGAYAEPWIFRYKDLKSWWSNPHFNRVGGVRASEPTAWARRSKPFWFTELGCPAVDKGTNQPNVFYDPKSSESFFPYFSTGKRDDFIQHRYLQAMIAHWSEAEANPASDVYGGRMVDMSRAFVWAWDARPWPDFPGRIELWADGDNFARGHWLNGRIGAPALAEVVGEICGRAGATDVDLARVHGLVRGYVVDRIETGRQSLQPLMLTFGLDAFARADALVFASRTPRTVATVSADGFVMDEGEPGLTRIRAPDAEAAERVLFTYVNAEGEYQTGTAAASASERVEPSTSETTAPVLLAPAEADATVRRWLSEARVARETVTFSLPPSALKLAAGDVIHLHSDAGLERLRIDAVTEFGKREVVAVRVEPAAALQAPTPRDRPRTRPVISASPAHAIFLDLPLLTGEEVPHAPHVAVLKRPWAGPIAVYSSGSDEGYSLNRVVDRPAVIGTLIDPLPRGYCGGRMHWSGRLRLDWGGLSSVGLPALLGGANVAALKHESHPDCEIVQFATAELVAPSTYRIGGLLRGQVGTDGVVPEVWPAGSDFVLLNERIAQIDLPASARGLARHFRYGPATLGYDHPSYRHAIEAFAGVGLRPYRPAHLHARREPSGDIVIGWVRRTRIDGDTWAASEVPLGEERELYEVRILAGVAVVRTMSVSVTQARYALAEQVADGVEGLLGIQVAQVSDRFGAGPFAEVRFGA